MADAPVSIGDFLDPRELERQSERIEKAFDEGRPLREAMKVSRDVIEAKYAFAYEQFVEGDHKTGVDIYRYLVVLDPYDVRFWLGLGASWLARKNPGKALEACFAAVMVDPKSSIALTMCALVYVHVGSQPGGRAALAMIGERDALAEATGKLVESTPLDPGVARREADSLIERCMRHLSTLPAPTNLDTPDAQKAKAKEIIQRAEKGFPPSAPSELKQFTEAFVEGFEGNIIHFALQYLQ